LPAEEPASGPTELAYLPDIASAYVRSFRSRVVARPPGAVVLARTYFYPAGGGQPGDRGSLRLGDGAEVRVVDVAKSGPFVVHRIKSPAAARAPEVGAEVEGTIDWVRRHQHMRLHTAQHFLSARIFSSHRLRTRTARLAGMRATIDLEGPLPPSELARFQTEFRDAVDRPRDVTIRFVARAEWDRNPASERSGLVPLPPPVDPVRVVEISGCDVCPCGGTHLGTTAEIGAVEVEPFSPLADGASQVAFRLRDASTPNPSG
jgi:misacylated tRNA(Ala) deacylase